MFTYFHFTLSDIVIKIKIHSSCEIEDFVETHLRLYIMMNILFVTNMLYNTIILRIPIIILTC